MSEWERKQRLAQQEKRADAGIDLVYGKHYVPGKGGGRPLTQKQKAERFDSMVTEAFEHEFWVDPWDWMGKEDVLNDAAIMTFWEENENSEPALTLRFLFDYQAELYIDIDLRRVVERDLEMCELGTGSRRLGEKDGERLSAFIRDLRTWAAELEKTYSVWSAGSSAT